MNIQEKLHQDEVVQYIAHRHHLTTQEVIAWFLPSEKNLQASCLEDNEIEIIRELIKRN